MPRGVSVNKLGRSEGVKAEFHAPPFLCMPQICMDIDASGCVPEELFFGSCRRHLNEEYLAINLMEIDLGGAEEQHLRNTNLKAGAV